MHVSISNYLIETNVYFSINCSWTTWTSWSSCSKSCGDSSGIKTRTRNQCDQTETDTEICLVNKCPIDCQHEEWSEWSGCSQTCGTGQRSRTREISNKELFGGKPCLDSDSKETENCIAHTCPVHGHWGKWSRWSYCNVTCGNGHKIRTRICDNPKPENGGFDCIGDEKQVNMTML